MCVFQFNRNRSKQCAGTCKDVFESLQNNLNEKVLVTPEALELAKTYVTEKVVGETILDDCIPPTTATANKVDRLVSRNFKPIVNVYRIRGYIQ